jgi:type VI secretion system protein ImpG
MRADDETLRYYLEELSYLREMGAEFSRAHSMVASQLGMPAGVSDDPHVARLTESFAFLTGRIRRSLDAEFPRLTEALLGVLYPQLAQPVPPMAIARFQVDPTRLKSATGYRIEKNTPLIARSVDGLPCRFRTSYPVNLLPLEVDDVAIEPARNFDLDEPRVTLTHVLTLRVRTGAAGLKLKELDFPRLRFFLNGTPDLTRRLYDLLFSSVAAVRLRVPPSEENPQPASIRLDSRSVRQVGFGANDDVIPCPSHCHPGYRLLQEYFHFPDKFRFFDVKNMDRLKDLDLGESGRFEILFLLTEGPGAIRLRKDSFVLGCTPVVNLFARTTEPLRLDHRQLEYRLVGDQRRERTTEIHSILSVSASSNPEEKKAARYEPFYSFRHVWGNEDHQAFWMESRRRTEREDLPGTDVYLSFLDLDFQPASPADKTVYAHTLCTNRELALDLAENTELQIETPAPIHAVSCLVRPTPSALPLLGGKTTWQLVSNLSLNHLSLASAEGLEAWREMLRIYALHDAPSVRQQINGIWKTDFRRVQRRFGSHGVGGFRAGSQVTLEFDTDRYTGSSAILFASVLRHFLALHTSVNSFVQVAARRKRDEKGYIWKRWAALAGEQPMI